ncbi:hypothetical protein [Dethiosulfatarculus sandiegensis]|uniref:Uncharacterized protein n=1 Tax=Dethiosulfatarculus sandiegensis TaxID=1429043 RepID=A0A0D2JIA5_9BACT|nr:hypothetical protein [Dethiosulfatarculus sandiegensis]KIX15421.1 hypothetical protein X474_03685 [Dethiosulfatarculus sandiegensis]
MINPEIMEELNKAYPVLSEVNHGLVSSALLNAKLVTLKAGKPIFEDLQLCIFFHLSFPETSVFINNQSREESYQSAT